MSNYLKKSYKDDASLLSDDFDEKAIMNDLINDTSEASKWSLFRRRESNIYTIIRTRMGMNKRRLSSHEKKELVVELQQNLKHIKNIIRIITAEANNMQGYIDLMSKMESDFLYYKNDFSRDFIEKLDDEELVRDYSLLDGDLGLDNPKVFSTLTSGWSQKKNAIIALTTVLWEIVDILRTVRVMQIEDGINDVTYNT